MTDRAQFRASGMPQVLACAASRLLNQRVRMANGPRSTSASLRGQWCHAEAALSLVASQGATTAAEIVHPSNVKPSPFDRWMVQYYLAAVTELSSADMAIEVEAEFTHAFERFDLSGHIDAFAITGDATEAVLFDLKSGREYVDEAGDNAQILAYIVLLWLAYPTLRRIAGYIVQPQNDPDEGYERITEFVVEGEDKLKAAAAYFERELNDSCDNQFSFNSDGWKQCRYCPAAQNLACPAILGDIANMKLTLTPEQFAAIKVSPDDGQLASLELVAKKFTPIFDATHDLLKERLASRTEPLQVEGARFYIEDRPGKRKITDNKAATEILSDLSDEAFHGTYEYKPAAIEEALAAHHKLPKTSTKGESGKSKFKEKLGHITEQSINKVLKIV